VPERSNHCRRHHPGTASRSRQGTHPAQLGKGAGQGPRAVGLHGAEQNRRRRMHKQTPDGEFMGQTSTRSNERLTANDASMPL